MSRFRSRKLRAVVLGSRKWRERDRIAYFACEDYGRLDALIFGARKVSGRWTGKFEPFNLVELLVERKSREHPWAVREVELVRARGDRGSAKEQLVAQAAAELFVHVSPGEETGKEIFELATGFSESLAGARQPVTMLLALAFHWSASAGFGAPEAGLTAELRPFVDRAIGDSPPVWRRYRLEPGKSSALVGLAKRHIESCTDRRWLGVEFVQ